jgi:hypothetical protein
MRKRNVFTLPVSLDSPYLSVSRLQLPGPVADGHVGGNRPMSIFADENRLMALAKMGGDACDEILETAACIAESVHDAGSGDLMTDMRAGERIAAAIRREKGRVLPHTGHSDAVFVEAALDHLALELSLLAELPSMDRCSGLDDAQAFYNAARPHARIVPTLGYVTKLVSVGPMDWAGRRSQMDAMGKTAGAVTTHEADPGVGRDGVSPDPNPDYRTCPGCGTVTHSSRGHRCGH